VLIRALSVALAAGGVRPTLINTRDFSLASHIATVNAGVRQAKGDATGGGPEPSPAADQQRQGQEQSQQAQPSAVSDIEGGDREPARGSQAVTKDDEGQEPAGVEAGLARGSGRVRPAAGRLVPARGRVTKRTGR
jgi:hypothetical protein